ncbi:hypothetical protein B0T26DRAFT_742384 [Lasiosphaeria miniovina]|uniref:Glucose-methanol-choline oxidoreductase C-terminal domain-containing protein n=1 Tax=Lasiosphaeria miniovina TaxID=1954250 RepID=A0AA40ADJ9_9PEZI|nr:uncharacterized protein B0T26DRAFT_742384 [Lasiosphaeria miniovina]KAK0713881.1 hypothetical protein B0T26DRAFT_742384 [Lasiosphaeria miniovina]
MARFCGVCMGGISLLLMLVVAPVTVFGSNYTFFITGTGIAGLTIADRLTEDPSVESIGTVCVKVVGGRSAIHAIVFLRGDEGDYDAWSSPGNLGWHCKGLLPFFLKSENFTRPDPTFARAGNISWDDSFRGNSGPVQNSYPNYFFLGSANPASVGANLEPNSGTLLSNATYNAEQRALYDSARKGLYTIMSTLSTNIGSLARVRNPADSLPADVDPTILEGYKAQRSFILQHFENSTVGVGLSTADSAVIYHEKPLSRIFSAPAMRTLDPVEASPFGAQLMTDDEIAACRTAAMMPRELGGVVLSEQKVYGVAGLRVADIGFWPMQIAAAPIATMYASAEKLADAIKKEYHLAEYQKL